MFWLGFILQFSDCFDWFIHLHLPSLHSTKTLFPCFEVFYFQFGRLIISIPRPRDLKVLGPLQHLQYFHALFTDLSNSTLTAFVDFDPKYQLEFTDLMAQLEH